MISRDPMPLKVSGAKAFRDELKGIIRDVGLKLIGFVLG
jgi:hypothetical protein